MHPSSVNSSHRKSVRKLVVVMIISPHVDERQEPVAQAHAAMQRPIRSLDAFNDNPSLAPSGSFWPDRRQPY
jgi:hypothetical protein